MVIGLCTREDDDPKLSLVVCYSEAVYELNFWAGLSEWIVAIAADGIIMDSLIIFVESSTSRYVNRNKKFVQKECDVSL